MSTLINDAKAALTFQNGPSTVTAFRGVECLREKERSYFTCDSRGNQTFYVYNGPAGDGVNFIPFAVG